jgi:outer membrane protein OmpA-like peptidoglycan-associated protein
VTAADATPSFQAYGNYDFVAGEQIVAVEDFSQDAIGDFPAQWDTDVSGEVVTIADRPGRWLKLGGRGFYTPKFITALPDSFTLEFDVLTPPQFSASSMLNTVFAELGTTGVPGWRGVRNNFNVRLRPGSPDGSSQTELRQNGASAPANSQSAKFSNGSPAHVSIWRQRERVRVYVNGDKVWDLARALVAGARYDRLLFVTPDLEPRSEYYIANLRLAVGAPDTRNKLLTQGKWVTHGILFDVNSDRVRPESYGALKEISGVLGENPVLRVQVVGHTDSDGDPAANLDLSKRRAAAVRIALAKEFGIDAARIDTDGKGASQPVDKNDTAAGKANNRRVEFVKQ